MKDAGPEVREIETRIAARLRVLRDEAGWSLDDLAARSGVSRSTLSRIENGQTSPAAGQLGRLCAAFGITLSRLMAQVEDMVRPLVRRDEQAAWRDPHCDYRRLIVSPPDPLLSGEAVRVDLGPGVEVGFDAPPRPGLEHHLVMLDGELAVTVDDAHHALSPGDCLRYRLGGPSRFQTPPGRGASYLVFMV